MISLIYTISNKEQKLLKTSIKSNKLKQLFNAYLKNKVDLFKTECTGNSFYVYEKRLREKLYEFIANQTLENNTTEEVAPLRLLITARKLLLLENYAEGKRALKLAEKKAIEISHFGLLNEIYQTEIQYNDNLNKTDLIDIHRRLIRNNGLFIKQEKLNLAYARLKENFKSGSTANKGVEDLFYRILKELTLQTIPSLTSNNCINW